MNGEQVVPIHGTSSQMQGVGRLADGRAVFVPGAIPGEDVLIRAVKDAGRYGIAKLVRVVAPSAERRAPFCPRAGRCGGCSAQHMEYALTLRCKRQIVADALRRIGGQADCDVRETIGMESPFAYRAKAEFALDAEGKLGFTCAGSHAVVPGVDCALLEEGVVQTAEAVQRWLDAYGSVSYPRGIVVRSVFDGSVCLTICVYGNAPFSVGGLLALLPKRVRSVYLCRQPYRPAHAMDGSCELLWGDETLTETVGGLRFALHPQSFFQINRRQCERLVALAVDAAGEGRAADVYCGVGSISLALARKPEILSVMGYEIVPQAVENADRNAEWNGLAGKASFCAGNAAITLPRDVRRGERFDTVVVDPPRRGLDAEALQAIRSVAPKRIVYVSCDPATLARDVKELSREYAVRFAQPLDMFPWTEHVETVCLLSKLHAERHIEE